jgi:anti-sigma factor RsiW
MCPDREILSAYFDGELGPQWERKVRAHLAQCEACRIRLDEFRSLRQTLRTGSIVVPDEAPQRVWNRIQAERVAIPRLGLWKRKIVLPAPVFAGAMGLFALLLIGSVLFTMGYVDRALARNGEVEVKPMAIQVETVEDLIRYLESQNAYVEVNLQIPEGSNFYIFGEPQFLRAADYRGGR